MRKLFLILGFLALAGTLPSSTASADGGNSSHAPWNSPLITGDPKLNPDIKRPGPYTPKPKPVSSSSSASGGSVIQISDELTGTLTLKVEDLETGMILSVNVMSGDCLVIPQSEDGYIVELFQNGVRIDSDML